MTNKKEFIAHYQLAQEQSKSAVELSIELEIPLSEVYWRAKEYRKSSDLVGCLKKCRHGELSQNQFRNAYMQAVVDGLTAEELSRQLGIERNTIKCRAYKLRQLGINLPPLNRSTHKKTAISNHIDAGSFI